MTQSGLAVVSSASLAQEAAAPAQAPAACPGRRSGSCSPTLTAGAYERPGSRTAPDRAQVRRSRDGVRSMPASCRRKTSWRLPASDPISRPIRFQFDDRRRSSTNVGLLRDSRDRAGQDVRTERWRGSRLVSARVAGARLILDTGIGRTSTSGLRCHRRAGGDRADLPDLPGHSCRPEPATRSAHACGCSAVAGRSSSPSALAVWRWFQRLRPRWCSRIARSCASTAARKSSTVS